METVDDRSEFDGHIFLSAPELFIFVTPYNNTFIHATFHIFQGKRD